LVRAVMRWKRGNFGDKRERKRRLFARRSAITHSAARPAPKSRNAGAVTSDSDESDDWSEGRGSATLKH
jgi:hypothetical protein